MSGPDRLYIMNAAVGADGELYPDVDDLEGINSTPHIGRGLFMVWTKQVIPCPVVGDDFKVMDFAGLSDAELHSSVPLEVDLSQINTREDIEQFATIVEFDVETVLRFMGVRP